MFKVTSAKKWSIVLVAALVCIAVLFSACNPTKPFKGVTPPTGEGIDSNGGIAVRYGDYIYYVNGYQSNESAENTYVETEPRVGSVVRIKIADIEELLTIHDKDNLKDSEKTKEIAQAVRDHAETVIPNIYFSANTTTPALNGIYIFGDRIYITTPNDKLTAGGNPRTNESVLMSYNLDGTEPERHFTFSTTADASADTNNAQIWLYEDETTHKVYATYELEEKIYFLDVEAKTSTMVKQKGASEDEEANDTFTSVTFDFAGKALFFLDADGSICKLALGTSEYDIILKNETEEGEDHSHITYTIKRANLGYVYYTVSNHSGVDELNGLILYYANGEVVDQVALPKATDNAYGWKADEVILLIEEPTGYYGLYQCSGGDLKNLTTILSPDYNNKRITVEKLEGNLLYYTAEDETYVIDLENVPTQETDGAPFKGTPYGKSLSMTSATGWGLPDVITIDLGEDGIVNYVFTLGTNTVSLVRFDPSTKTASKKTELTLTPQPKEEDDKK